LISGINFEQTLLGDQGSVSPSFTVMFALFIPLFSEQRLLRKNHSSILAWNTLPSQSKKLIILQPIADKNRKEHRVCKIDLMIDIVQRSKQE
jgi:hypothetical protein